MFPSGNKSLRKCILIVIYLISRQSILEKHRSSLKLWHSARHVNLQDRSTYNSPACLVLELISSLYFSLSGHQYLMWKNDNLPSFRAMVLFCFVLLLFLSITASNSWPRPHPSASLELSSLSYLSSPFSLLENISSPLSTLAMVTLPSQPLWALSVQPMSG